MTRLALLATGLLSLVGVWFGPLPSLAASSFAAHMAIHMTVVAIAAPLAALAIAGGRFDPVPAAPALFAPIPASIVELLAVWGWHAPRLHAAARADALVFAAEQATFLAAGLLLWLSAVGGDALSRRSRSAAGVIALLFTSMHMTLLGALFALAPRALYLHVPAPGAATVADQQLGGAIMLVAGGAVYLAGGLWLIGRVLRTPAHGAGAPATIRPPLPVPPPRR